MSRQKYITVVDEEDNVIGSGTYEVVVESGKIFRSANIMVFNQKGKLFVHRRNRNLPTFAGMWDVKLGGIVDAGEGYEEAALRELEEEAGIKNAKLEFLFPLKFRKDGYNNNRRVYRCVYDGKMTLQESEIEEGRFIAVEEAKKMMSEGVLSSSAVAVFEEFLKNAKPAEYVDVVDEEDKFVRKATEMEMREKTLLHRAARIILVNKEGKFLVQKRSKNKELYPGYWDIGVSETLKSGESYESAAVRGLLEELGLMYISNIQLLHSFIAKLKFRSKQDNVNYKVYEYLCQGKVYVNKDEIEEAKFIPLEEVEKLISEGKFTPGGEMAFRECLKGKK